MSHTHRQALVMKGLWMELKDAGAFEAILRARGVSQRQLALAVGWLRWDDAEEKWHGSHGIVNGLVKGNIKTVTVEKGEAIAAYLHVPIDLLFATRSDRTPGDLGHTNGTPAAA